jgi:hypothetical protein
MDGTMQIYWATKPQEEIINDLMSRVDAYDEYILKAGIMHTLKDSYQTFYGDTRVRDVGVSGELKAIRINHYGSLIRNLISLVTNNKLAWQPIASNTDVESQSAAILAGGLLDFYMKDQRLDRVFKNGAIMASFLKEAWVSTTWNTQKGEIVHPGIPEEGTPAYHEGDLEFSLYGLNDIIRDYSRTTSEFDWLISRDFVNKYDLIAQFPESENELMGISIDKMKMDRIRVKPLTDDMESELIPFYTFYFKKTPSLPNGRMVEFVDGKVLTDSPLPYDRIPLTRIAAEDTFEDCFGHSPMMDVLPIQKGIDMLASTLLSNNAAFGVQNISVEKGSGFSVTQIHGGLNLLEHQKGTNPPQPLQLTASAPETYKFLDMLIAQGQLLSGVNDAIRGQAPAGTSGAALALLSQQAIQFANGLQQSYISLAEDTGTLAIQILQKYANTKRIATLAGKHNRPLLKEWSKQDLEGVSRVTIEAGNALSKTAAGRLQIADSLQQGGHIQRPEQYISVLETGRLEPMYEAESRQLLLIRAENEKLSDGAQVRALMTDAHEQHILEHASVLSSPEARDNPNSPVVQNALAHIMEHLDMVRNMDPGLAAILKQQPLPPPIQPQAPQPGPQPQGPAPQGPAPQQAGPAGNVPEIMDGTPAVTQQAGNVNLPQMPVNKATGQRFNPNQQ